MSSYQNVSADGTTVTLGLNGNPAITYTSSGAQFTKNKLINGEVTRINQRAFNGTWSGKSVFETQAATQAAKELAFGYDRWFRSNAARSDGTGANENMGQYIEEGNYRPNTVHTLSGTGVTTTQITSPASGNWKIVVAQGATNVQVEEGNVATPFENRPIQVELDMCQRYYEQILGVFSNVYLYWPWQYKVIKRSAPVFSTFSGSNAGAALHPGTLQGTYQDTLASSVSAATIAVSAEIIA